MLDGFIEHFEGSEILFYLKVKKVACHIFMLADETRLLAQKLRTLLL